MREIEHLWKKGCGNIIHFSSTSDDFKEEDNKWPNVLVDYRYISTLNYNSGIPRMMSNKVNATQEKPLNLLWDIVY